MNDEPRPGVCVPTAYENVRLCRPMRLTCGLAKCEYDPARKVLAELADLASVVPARLLPQPADAATLARALVRRLSAAAQRDLGQASTLAQLLTDGSAPMKGPPQGASPLRPGRTGALGAAVHGLQTGTANC